MVRNSDNEAEEMPEIAVPSQFMSVFDAAKGKFVTKAAEHV